MMLIVLCVLSLASAEELVVLSAPSPLPSPALVYSPLASPYQYHERVGVPEARRIRAEESRGLARVAGGLNSYPGEHKFFAGLVITLKSGQTSVCGGALVSWSRVLTAAACWYDGYDQARSFLAVLGSVTLFSGGTRVTATGIAVHPRYTSNLDNNVAVLSIPNIYRVTGLVKPVALDTSNLTHAGRTAQIIGFGKISESSSINSEAQRDAFVPVVSNGVCEKAYGPMIRPQHVCTSGAGGRGACAGDLGGPLVVASPALADDVLIGVVSFWSPWGCAAGHPSGYTRVSHYYNWIRSRL